MSTSLTHSPARIVRQLLVNDGQGTDPADDGSWPIYYNTEPDREGIITVVDRTGRPDGRMMPTGEQVQHHGIQVLVKGGTHDVGYTKANSIFVWMSETALNNSLTISGSSYVVYCFHLTSPIIDFEGQSEQPATRRHNFSINAVAAIRQTA